MCWLPWSKWWWRGRSCIYWWRTLYYFPTCSDHALWIELGSAGWQAEVGPAYGAENKVSIGGMPGFTGKLTEDEIYAVVVFERVVLVVETLTKYSKTVDF